MKCLNVIFTYNRPLLLRNCVASYLEFGPDGDLMIVDDGSSLPEQRDYLAGLASGAAEKNIRVWIRDRDDSNRLGGLYANLEAVTRLAIEQEYDYLFYIQDDDQFMWRDEFFWQKVGEIFREHPDALMVRPVFDRLIFSHDAANRLEVCAGCPGILFKKSWFAAVGIVRPAHLRKLEWRFEPTELKNNLYSKSLGLSIYLLKTPTLAIVPIPSTWRFGRQTAVAKPPVEKYYLKPLSDAQIQKLGTQPGVAYLEDYCIPWGWRAWAPYNHSDNYRKYYANLWRWFKRSRLRRWPRLRGAR